MTLTVRRAEREEWRQYRDLRLEMLADTPHAYLTRLEVAERYTDDQWQTRHNSNFLPDTVVYAAVTDDGSWVGMMAAREYLSPTPRIWLLSVYVSPAHRQTDVARRLLDAIEDWTRRRGYHELFLDVHERAAAARRFYAREGFVETGHSQPYELNPTERELEMVKQLDPKPR